MANFRIYIGLLFCAVLLFSFRNINSPTLIRYIPSECNKELDSYLLIDRIIGKEVKGDSLYLTLGLKENCAMRFNPGISFNNNILNIDLDTTPINKDGDRSIALCDCCFELTLVLTGIPDTSFAVMIDNQFLPYTSHPYKIYEEKYDIYNGDTVNRVNHYGLAQGVWVKFDNYSGKVESKEYYEGQYSMERPIWTERYSNGIIQSKNFRDTSWSYDENGIVQSKTILHKRRDQYPLLWLEEFKYYPNGQLKSHCIPSKYQQATFNVDDLDSCQYWNEKGRVVKNLP